MPLVFPVQTPAKLLVGSWMRTTAENQFVDFGIMDGDVNSRNFVNGLNESILLDFKRRRGNLGPYLKARRP